MVTANDILLVSAVSKAFGPVQALNSVDLSVRAGEVHAVVGENGAGKSTLMKVLSGAYHADSGSIELDGSAFAPETPMAARRAGIAMIYQELTLAPHLSVAANITLGLERRRFGCFLGDRSREVRAVLARLGHEGMDLEQSVGELPIGQQQVVEIARALMLDAKVLIMDEPTSSLSDADKAALFGVIKRVRDDGTAVIYISHFLDEVQCVADRFTVLRDGEAVATGVVAETNLDEIVEAMVGRTLDEMYPKLDHASGEALLDASGVTGVPIPLDIHLKVHRGEILGIAGLVGAGRTEFLRTLFGLEPAVGGHVRVGEKGYLAIKLTPSRMLALGVNHLSENRKDEGLATRMTLTENITLGRLSRYRRAGLLELDGERWVSQALCTRLNVKYGELGDPVDSLSGGNQQKVALARLLHDDSEVLLLDEPTRGIDVGSKAEIYRLIQELAGEGRAIILVSSYLPELFGVCDTLAVMHRGRLSSVKPVSDWTETEVMRLATTGW